MEKKMNLINEKNSFKTEEIRKKVEIESLRKKKRERTEKCGSTNFFILPNSDSLNTI